MTKITSLLFSVLIIYSTSFSQLTPERKTFNRQDTLRGSITPEREWWDVLEYNISVEPDFETKTIAGSNTITFKTTASGQRLQLDMQLPMEILSVEFKNKEQTIVRDGNVYFVTFEEQLVKGTIDSIKIKFAGKPREAITPPWDGGWIWKRDSHGDPWMSVACQGLGASVWYPCKDHQSDEPDSASLTIIVPSNLKGVGNGRLVSTQTLRSKTAYTWKVVNPINSYNIVPYIGNYVSWNENFAGEKGNLSVSYWVLKENLEKAKKQFRQVPEMLRCFEHWLGPYPFYEDGYKIVESPHLGMEHQSAIAYGNGFANGYLGKDLSGTGWGEKWDFIIVHESGHEWFANSITTKDLADMWVHEGFTNYSEVLFTECQYGKAAGNEYAIGLRRNINNDKPLIAPYGVNKEGSIDMYYKGSNLVHMIRQIMNDDAKFRAMLRDMNKKFYHQTVTSKQIENFLSDKTGRNLSKVFDQYLRTTNVPVLEYSITNGKLKFRWNNCVEGFDMPVKITAEQEIWLKPTTQWKEIACKQSDISVDPNFYILSRKM